jgi:hypothetical protein
LEKDSGIKKEPVRIEALANWSSRIVSTSDNARRPDYLRMSPL